MKFLCQTYLAMLSDLLDPDLTDDARRVRTEWLAGCEQCLEGVPLQTYSQAKGVGNVVQMDEWRRRNRCTDEIGV
jgi:hypothetical protein